MWVEARLSLHSESVSMVAKVLGRLPSMPPNVVLCTDDAANRSRQARSLEPRRFEMRPRAFAAEDAIRMATLNAAMRFGLRPLARSHRESALISALFPSSKHASQLWCL